jgi:heme/copper-type cytochrome/quinol oxidase subunit 1
MAAVATPVVQHPRSRHPACKGSAAGSIISGLGTILGAVNVVTTVICPRAPGMTLFRFTWNQCPGADGVPDPPKVHTGTLPYFGIVSEIIPVFSPRDNERTAPCSAPTNDDN